MAATSQFSWSPDDKAAAKYFFDSGVSGDQIYNRAQELGLGQDQLADLWATSTGKGTYDQAYGIIGDYLKQTGKTLKGGSKLGMPSSATPVTTPVASMSPVASSGQGSQFVSKAPEGYKSKFAFDNNSLAEADAFFSTNPSVEQIYKRAGELGLGLEEVSDLYVQSKGGFYDPTLNMFKNAASSNGWKPLTSSGRFAVNNVVGSGGATKSGSEPQRGSVDGPYSSPIKASNGSEAYATYAPRDASVSNWNVTSDQTVEGRLQGLLQQNNPLVQIAQTQGMQAANDRGLLNSSLGAEAGALAHYQYAMPIAQADATTAASASRQNADNQTNVNLQNANASNAAGQFGANAYNTVQNSKLQAENQMAILDKQNANAIAALEPQYAQQVRLNYTAAMSSAMSQYQAFISQIQLSDASPEAKTSQIKAAQDSLQNTTAFFDAMYSNMPNWSKEWSLVPKA